MVKIKIKDLPEIDDMKFFLNAQIFSLIIHNM